MRYEVKSKGDTYIIHFFFNHQSCEVQIDATDRRCLVVRSTTDGYAWLHFFLSNAPNTKQLIDMKEDEISAIKNAIPKIFSDYKSESSSVALISLSGSTDMDMAIDRLVKFMMPRLANRERFFDDGANFNQHQSL